MKIGVSLAIAVFAGAALPAAPASAQDYAVVATNLFGSGVTGGGAAESGGGDFDGEIDFAENRICYYFEVYGLEGVDAAHIHKGAEGQSGPAVLTLALPSEDADEICTEADPALLRSLADNPADYYVDIHTPAYTEAALRGQLHD